jgi:nitrate reductase gamma subunit
MDIHQILYGVYPYLCLATFILGSWIRFDHEQYTWKSDSSQLLSKQYMRFASNVFHIGILGIFGGGVFGLMVILGGVILWMRRLFNPRVRAASRWMDINILGWLIMTALVGFSTIFWSIEHASHGDASTMLRLADWVQSIVMLQPKPDLLRDVDLVFKLHIFLGMSVFLFFPFTRLVHIWSAPFGYLFRAYQIVRAKRTV